MKNTHGGVLLLITLQASACNFTKSNICSMGVFSSFLNCTIGTKLRKASVCYSIVTRIQILITVACIFCCTMAAQKKSGKKVVLKVSESSIQVFKQKCPDSKVTRYMPANY